MRDRERVELAVSQQPRRAAGATSSGAVRQVVAAIAAEAEHRPPAP
jgi:hypothetical protein